MINWEYFFSYVLLSTSGTDVENSYVLLSTSGTDNENYNVLLSVSGTDVYVLLSNSGTDNENIYVLLSVSGTDVENIYVLLSISGTDGRNKDHEPLTDADELSYNNQMALYEVSQNSVHFFPQFSKQKILDSSKLKEIVDYNFKFNKNSGKLAKKVENTEKKEKIAQ